MKLVNAIEFAPYHFAKKDHKSPDSTGSDDEWYIYWKRCLADSSIFNLEPIAKRSWLVDIDTVQDDELFIFIEKTFEKEDFEEIEKNIYGGIVIFENEKIILSTQCCGDLSNLDEWDNIFGTKTDDWTMLWIGHPFVYYRYNNSYIEFSEATEGSADVNTKVDFKVSLSWLKSQINEIRDKQDNFRKRIENIFDI